MAEYTGPEPRQPEPPAAPMRRPDVLYGMHNTEVVAAMDALLYGRSGDVQAILEYLSLNRVHLGNGWFCVSVSRIQGRVQEGNAAGIPCEQVLSANGAFAGYVEELLLRKAIYYMVPVRGTVVCILAAPHCSGEQERLREHQSLLREACRQATERLNTEVGLTIVTAISPMFSGPEQLPLSFHRTLDMLEFATYFGQENGIFLPGGLEHQPTWYLHRVSDLESRCRVQCSLLAAGKTEAFSARLEEAIHDLRNNVPGSLQQFKADCFQYVSVLIAQLMDRKLLLESQIQEIDLFGLIEQSETDVALMQRLRELLQTLTAPYFRQLQEADFASASSMQKYIREHFMDANLTVTAIAAAFQMTQAAFSAYYKRKLGRSPLEDLNRCRVQHAYHLLETGATSLEAIMHASGFDSSSTMHRLFKKYYHATPAQLRRNLNAPGLDEEAHPAEGL